MKSEEQIRYDSVKEVAHKMLIAARTAPKGRGDDNTVLLLLETDEIKSISEKLLGMGEALQINAFVRDAKNILSAQVMILVGSRIKPLGLKKCGMCGFENCQEKDQQKNIPCVFNTGDLGIAIGSAVSIAMDNRVDNRIMYTVGQAALEMGLFDEDVKIVYGIPLSVSGKNPFFDRK